MRDDVAIEFKIVGSDNTPVINMLEYCTVNIRSGTSIRKNATIFNFLNKFQESLCLISYEDNISEDGVDNPKNDKSDIKSYHLKSYNSLSDEVNEYKNHIRFFLEKYGISKNEDDDSIKQDLEVLKKELEKGKEKEKEELEEILKKIDIITHFDGISNSHPYILLLKSYQKLIFDNETENIIVGHRKYSENKKQFEKNKRRLCSIFKGKTYFGNIVGTVSKSFTWNQFFECFEKDLGLKEKDYNKEYKIAKDYKIAITIEICSRFDKPNRPFFLLDMLTKGNLAFNNNYVPQNDENYILDCLLLFQLKQHLLDAYQKGIYRAYHSFNENGTKIKGSIDFANHIKLNMGLKNGRVSFSYREKTADNYLNHLILLAYQHLKKKHLQEVIANIDNDYEVKSVIDSLLNETHFPKYSKSLLLRKCVSPISHPYYTEYEDLRKICISILRDEGFSLFGGSGADTQGILYYIPDLWEEYLESKMIGFRMNAQKTINIFSNDEGKYTFPSRPDFIFYDKFNGNKDIPYLVLDAKFIPRWFYTAHCKGKINSVVQDYNKCIRDKDSLDVFATGTIFPYSGGDDKCGDIIFDIVDEQEKEDETDVSADKDKSAEELRNIEKNKKIKVHSISIDNKSTVFYTIPIFVPEVGDKVNFSNWKKIFDKEISNQMGKLGELVNFEKEKYLTTMEKRKELNDLLEEIGNFE